ncbi:polygalacturonate 4-alpha-galacturonosyltransferase-like isoform X2 [Macadamia integrifolia]|uniref:polygalacturonate 4-alpha-galacturonosyltransferase-like isoform X2 n=1 Tax=Macadamia integrifolia TaxID=60698 RepID=UPI001C4E86BB|nr:polygalacturonate 4-alpha-galacturonosyltransferase-like isoform X2 [Macadamia integrifolia]
MKISNSKLLRWFWSEQVTMPLRRGSSGAGRRRNRSGCCRVPFAILLFFAVAPLLFLIGRNLHTTTTATIDPSGIQTGTNVQNLDWREQLAKQYFTSIFSKEVIDTITANIDDMGPLSLDFVRKNSLSSSWKVLGLEDSDQSNSTLTENEILLKSNWKMLLQMIMLKFLINLKKEPDGNCERKGVKKGQLI